MVDGIEIYETHNEDRTDAPGDFRWRRTSEDPDFETIVSDPFPTFEAAMMAAASDNADCVALINVPTGDGLSTRMALTAVDG